MRLVAHLTVTSFIFLALVSLVWAASWVFHSLHAAFPFPDETYEILRRLEIILLYTDVVVSSAVLLSGIWTYLSKVIGGKS